MLQVIVDHHGCFTHISPVRQAMLVMLGSFATPLSEMIENEDYIPRTKNIKVGEFSSHHQH